MCVLPKVSPGIVIAGAGRGIGVYETYKVRACGLEFRVKNLPAWLSSSADSVPDFFACPRGGGVGKMGMVRTRVSGIGVV